MSHDPNRHEASRPAFEAHYPFGTSVTETTMKNIVWDSWCRALDWQAAQVCEVAAYEHTLQKEDGTSENILSYSYENPFGIRGRDYDPSYEWTCKALHSAPPAAAAQVCGWTHDDTNEEYDTDCARSFRCIVYGWDCVPGFCAGCGRRVKIITSETTTTQNQ